MVDFGKWMRPINLLGMQASDGQHKLEEEELFEDEPLPGGGTFVQTCWKVDMLVSFFTGDKLIIRDNIGR